MGTSIVSGSFALRLALSGPSLSSGFGQQALCRPAERLNPSFDIVLGSWEVKCSPPYADLR
jgi:hypothetical protein